MNCLKQVESGIISSKKDLDAFAKKKTAKLLVVSDSHGMFSALSRVILKYGESSDALVFAGDGVSDLAAFLNSCAKNDAFLKCLPPVVAFVRGNNDASMFSVQFDVDADDELPCTSFDNTGAGFPPLSFNSTSFFYVTAPKSVVLKVAGKTVFVTHGHEYGAYYATSGIEQAALEHSAHIAIFGHTHFPFEELHEVYIINPGSLSYPRNHSRPGFAFLNITERENCTVFLRGVSSALTDFEPYNPELLYW